MPDPLPPGIDWRTIDELDRRVGGYCWQERRLFELTGGWAGAEGAAEIRVYFSGASARHAFFASQWHDRLPVRAGVDVPALIRAPRGAVGPALGRLEGITDPVRRLGALVGVLPYLLAAYHRHLDGASPVNEGPVIDVLRLVEGRGNRELAAGRVILQRQLEDEGQAEEVAEICGEFERLFTEG